MEKTTEFDVKLFKSSFLGDMEGARPHLDRLLQMNANATWQGLRYRSNCPHSECMMHRLQDMQPSLTLAHMPSREETQETCERHRNNTEPN